MDDDIICIDDTTGPATYAVDINPSTCRKCVHEKICATGMACDRYMAWVETGRIDMTLSDLPYCIDNY